MYSIVTTGTGTCTRGVLHLIPGRNPTVMVQSTSIVRTDQALAQVLALWERELEKNSRFLAVREKPRRTKKTGKVYPQRPVARHRLTGFPTFPGAKNKTRETGVLGWQAGRAWRQPGPGKHDGSRREEQGDAKRKGRASALSEIRKMKQKTRS